MFRTNSGNESLVYGFMGPDDMYFEFNDLDMGLLGSKVGYSANSLEYINFLYKDSGDPDGDGLSTDYEEGYGRYELVQSPLAYTRDQADLEAKSRYNRFGVQGQLAIITSSKEQAIIASLLDRDLSTSSPCCWLGGLSANWSTFNSTKYYYWSWASGVVLHQLGA